MNPLISKFFTSKRGDAGWFGLRARLLLGLAVVSLVLVVSVGFVALWAVERSLEMEQDLRASTLADGAARVLESTLKDEHHDLSDPSVRAAIERTFSGLSRHGGFIELGLRDSKGAVFIVGDTRGNPDPESDPFLTLVRNAPQVSMKRYKRDPSHPRGEGLDYAFYRRVAVGNEWVVMRIIFSADEAVSRLMSRAKKAVWVLAVIDGILVLVLAGVFLTKAVINPIRRLESAVRRVAGGELAVKVEAGGADEIGRLSEAFDDMTRKLRENNETMEEQIRELRMKQDELDASWVQLIRAEKFASVGRLAAGVAHEVGNPLTAVVGYTEMLQDENLGKDERREFLDLMETELKRVDTTIRGLLDYSRRDKGPLTGRDPREIVHRAARLVTLQKKMKCVDIKVRLPQDLPLVMVSESSMEQVLVNLFLNAADAMSGKGEIRIHGGVIEKDEESDEGGDLSQRGDVGENRSNCKWVELVISDTGPGIPQELRDKVFDPFFTTKDVGEGTGLGLAISQSLMETMGGKLELDDTEKKADEGACFRITLKTVSPEVEALLKSGVLEE